MALTGWILDKSAAARADDPVVGAGLAELAGSLFVCPVGELEQLYSARSAADYDALKSSLHASFRIVRVGVPVQVQGLAIQPGDLLHGDENGLLKIPHAACDNLLEAVERVRTREKKLMDSVRAPEFSVAQLKGRFIE